MKANEKPIIVQQTFEASKKEVWEAITDQKEMPKWFFKEIENFEPKVGFVSSFTVEVEGVKYPHRWKVTAVEPMEKIEYDWSYDGFKGQALASFKLDEVSGGTQLTLTFETIKDFEDNPIFSREAGVGGWTYFISDSLQTYLK